MIRGELQGQICQEDGGCVPLSSLDTRFTARLDGQVADNQALAERVKRRTPPIETSGPVALAVAGPGGPSPIPADTRFTEAPAEGYRAANVHVTIQGRIEPAGAAPGETVELVITAVPDPGWHIYAQAARDPEEVSKPTLIAVAEPAGWIGGSVKASDEAVVKPANPPFEPEQRYHEGTVTWRMPIRIPASARPGPHTIKGLLGYQTCSDASCDRPTGAFVAGTIQVGKSAPGSVPLRFAPGKYATVATFLAGESPVRSEASASVSPSVPLAFDLSQIQAEATESQSTIYIVVIAFLGGFLLNFMPCVLPVIGLKVMSFVQQAGEHRARVFTLNLWYALGMLSIFWLLATLASAASLGLSDESLGWGEQFNYEGFTIPLLCVVFVMGLSFIGVWEIPIPGFVGSGAATDLAQKEGLAGAFSKGVLTTILATPCSGPGLATALTWSATKPPHLVYLVFTCMGFGMALPYLLIGAFPNLVRFIPKPGAWMDTFKQLMGFVLMGTVVYMFTLIDQKFVVPTLALIFALWAACWWIGRTPITASTLKKASAWFVASGFAAVVGWLAFAYEVDRRHDLPWEEFSLAALDEHISADRTVMVDFTARWCPTCKVLERSVLNTKPVQQVVEKNDVVTLVADWSDGDEEIGRVLEALGSKQLPVIAIFPAGDPYRPKKLAGMYTRSELVGKLRAAGPSQSPRLASDSR